MARKNKTGRIFRYLFIFCFTSFTRYASVALLAALLQFPAFLSSCSKSDTPLKLPAQVRIRAQYPHSAEALDVFFFDTLGAQVLDAYQQIVCDSAGHLYALSGAGARHMVVLSGEKGHRERWMDLRTYGQLCKHTFHLENEDPASPLLAGEMDLEAGASRRADIVLRPRLSAVRIRSVSCDFSGRPYAGEAFFVNRLFLCYAGAECHPLGPGDAYPVSWLNPGLLDSMAVMQLRYPEMVLQEGCGSIGAERKAVDRSFYCYPHPDTRLVLEGDVGAVHCYYPIPLRNLRGGEVLELDITLRRMGSPHPDIPTESDVASLDAAILPWDTRPGEIIPF